MAGGPTHGDVQRYYEKTVLTYSGHECLIWPYARNPNGRAMGHIDGKTITISRLVCVAANGQPPTPDHIAAHSCGNGHLGCVAKRHLRWATKKENGEDRARHGSMDKRIAALEEALEPFGDIDNPEADDDFTDDTPVTISFGRTTFYAVKLGDFRRARAALNSTNKVEMEDEAE